MYCAPDALPTYDEALARLLAAAGVLGCEAAALEEADGRVLARSVLAPRSRPATAVSAMDGYAVREADLALMRSGGLRLAGRTYAGGLARMVGPGEAVRVTTGAPMPAGADRVVVDEATAREGELVRLAMDPGGRRHVRAAGSDFREGAVLVEAGAALTAQALMAAAAGEAGLVSVVRRPRVGLVLTGDEIASPAACGGRADRIPDSVSFGVAALVRAWGGVVAGVRRAADRAEDVAEGLASLQARSDLVVIIGGASKSERDLGRATASGSGAGFLFAGVAIKPGKPVWAAKGPGGLVVGLPGNPTAALVTARLLLAPLVAQLGGRGAAAALGWTPAELPGPRGDRETFLLARRQGEGLALAGAQDSSGQACLALADTLVRRPAAGAPGRIEALAL